MANDTSGSAKRKEQHEWQILRQQTMRFALSRVRRALGVRLEQQAKREGKAISPSRRGTLTERAKGDAERIQSAVRDYFRVREEQEAHALRAANELASETAWEMRSLIERFGREAEKLPAWPLVGKFADLRRFVTEPPAAAAVIIHAWEPAGPLEWSAIDLVIAQFPTNGGDGRCRVCNGRLLDSGDCAECGAKSIFAQKSVPGAMWWDGKARPRDLATLIVIADKIVAAQWAHWASAGETPQTAHEALANRVRTRLGQLRKRLRERRRRSAAAQLPVGV